MSTSLESTTPMGEAHAALAPFDAEVIAQTTVEATLEQPEELVVQATERIARLAAASSGALAVLAGYINEKRLYQKAGFTTMKEFATARLGVATTAAFKKLMKAARAARSLYPEKAAALVALIERGGHARIPELPALPDETKLVHLPRAVEGRTPNERAALLQAAVDNKTSSRALQELGKKKTVPPAARTNIAAGRNRRPEPSSGGATQRRETETGDQATERTTLTPAVSSEEGSAYGDDGVARGVIVTGEQGVQRGGPVQFVGRSVEVSLDGDRFLLRDLGPARGKSSYGPVVRVVELTRSTAALARTVAEMGRKSVHELDEQVQGWNVEP